MSTEQSPDEKVEILERRAKVIRSRLLRAVDALDARRHQVVEIGDTAKKLVVPAAATVVGLAAVFGIGVFAVGLVVRSRRRRSIGERFAHTIRELDLAPRPSLARRVFDRVALTAVTIATTEIARRGLKNVLDGRLLDGRLAIGRALGARRGGAGGAPSEHRPTSAGDIAVERLSGTVFVPAKVQT